jgi:hypothetical protein
LDKKFTRHNPESSVPEERVLAIRVKVNRSARAGTPWSPAVADFYMEMFPDMVEFGYTFDDIFEMFDGDY